MFLYIHKNKHKCKYTKKRTLKTRKDSFYFYVRQKTTKFATLIHRERIKRKYKHIINGSIWTFVSIYFFTIVLLHIPAIQHFIGSELSIAVGNKLGTKVEIKRVNLGIFNRVIIDGIAIQDQHGETMLSASRLSAKFDILSLFHGKLSISAAQLFGTSITTYRQNTNSKLNYQFVIDSLASKDTTQHSKLDFAIHSLIIRHGAFSYDLREAATLSRTFNTNHIAFQNISAHLILNQLTKELIDVNCKKLSLTEKSGLTVKDLTFKLTVNQHEAKLSHFHLQLPQSSIKLGECRASFKKGKHGIEMPSLQFIGSIDKSTITPCDLTFFYKSFKEANNPITLQSSFSGTSTFIRIKDIHITGKDLTLNTNGSLSNWQSTPRWVAAVQELRISANGIKMISESLGTKFNIPAEMTRLGNIHFQGFLGGYGQDLALKGILKTGQGVANIALGKHLNNFSGRLETKGINLGKILNNNKLGVLASSINIDGKLPTKEQSPLLIIAKGFISRFDYNQYSFQNIHLNGKFVQAAKGMQFKGLLNVDDPNGQLSLHGNISKINQVLTAQLEAHTTNLNLMAMHLPSPWSQALISGKISSNIVGKSLNTATGQLVVSNLNISKSDGDFILNELRVNTGYHDKIHYMNLTSDFGTLAIQGNFDYATLYQSITNQIGSKLPTLPGLPKVTNSKYNNFTINTSLYNSEWLKSLFNVPLELQDTVSLKGSINDIDKKINLICQVPHFTYADKQYEDAFIEVTTPNDTLKANARLKMLDDKGNGFYWNLQSHAANNKLGAILSWDNKRKKLFRGQLSTEADFFRTDGGVSSAHVKIHPSKILVGDTIWHVQPSDIIYSKNHLTVDHFEISHNKQHIIVSGMATKSMEDSLTVDLQDVNVNYILNLVNFHAVDFSGLATGQAYVTSVFTEPKAHANLRVNEFRFENGRMGTLFAHVNYNHQEGQINIDAQALDETDKQTIIKGYVSPKKNYIDLGIAADNTRLEFLESFCGTFMNNITATANGKVRLFGPLNNINLTGQLAASGNVHMLSLNTDYTLKNDTVTLIPDHIILKHDTIYDRNHNIGIVHGTINHEHLTNLTYNINVDARTLLAYDTHEFGGNTFYGTAYTTGTCSITGRSGEVVIDVNATPEKGSQFVYNVASPAAISSQEFIKWSDRDTLATDSIQHLHLRAEQDLQNEDDTPDIPTDIRIKFLINMTSDAIIRLIMDQQTGDYIDLKGTGGISATYYNKGSFDMFGNYVVSDGLYKLTIQNVIKKDFTFQQGGTISFGGDPYAARLNLNALYPVVGVSLSDLKIGRSFSSNNIRVNCLMNISGTPSAPKVDFTLDLPTVSSDVKQMVFSIINSEEEMKQQVLYLLAVGRFYTQGTNNATSELSAQQSQTSLAMQSLLSGTLSQQINNVLKNVVNNSNWNFGANISTGDEGLNNAEYEGLFSGQLLNNRLLFNGQMGYRDNAKTATSSFIGDFDLRYLIFPNGNFAIRVYNQTNDRYFIKNTLNTQGVGIILKKDFTNWRDLFRFRSKKRLKKEVDKNNK